MVGGSRISSTDLIPVIRGNATQAESTNPILIEANELLGPEHGEELQPQAQPPAQPHAAHLRPALLIVEEQDAPEPFGAVIAESKSLLDVENMSGQDDGMLRAWYGEWARRMGRAPGDPVQGEGERT